MERSKSALSAIPALLDKFTASAAAVQRQSPLDARAVPVIAVNMALFIAEAWYIAATDLSFHPSLVLRIFGMLILLLIGGLLARQYGMTRIGDTLLAITLPPVFSALTVVEMVILTRYSAPFADSALAGADRAMGLDWLAMFAVFQKHPALLEVGRVAYGSFYWQFMALSLVLFVCNRTARGWRFINAWAIALMVSALIYPFFTALGPYLHYGIVPADIPNLKRDAPWTTGPLIDAIRTHRNTDVVGSLTGLIFFPSFHAAGAVMYIWSWWVLRWMRWPMLVLNLMLICAAPVFGLHYFIDLVGGIIVGLCAIVLANRLVSRIEQRMARQATIPNAF